MGLTRTGRSGLLSLCLICAAMPGCDKAGSSRPAPSATPAASVPVLVTGTPVPYDTVLPQLDPKPRVVGKTAEPIRSVAEGLPEVQRISEHPLVGMSEQREWFFYATSVVQGDAGRPSTFLRGYAIKKGGREMVEWSVW